METALRVCANCRVLVRQAGGIVLGSPLLTWEHVPEFAEKFSRAVCYDPAPGRLPSGSEARFGLARVPGGGKDKLTVKGEIPELARAAGEPVTLAVDGSYKLDIGERVIKPMSWGYLTTNGLYGLGTSIVPGKVVGGRPLEDGSGRDPQRALQAELRAIAAGLGALADRYPVTVLCDSRDAIDLMLLWRDGHEVMPRGYNAERMSGRESTLARLARRALEHRDRITMRWVPSHTGHPLNEAADTLAKMARAWAVGRMDRDTVVERAPDTVRQALSAYAPSV